MIVTRRWVLKSQLCLDPACLGLLMLRAVVQWWYRTLAPPKLVSAFHLCPATQCCSLLIRRGSLQQVRRLLPSMPISVLQCKLCRLRQHQNFITSPLLSPVPSSQVCTVPALLCLDPRTTSQCLTDMVDKGSSIF